MNEEQKELLIWGGGGLLAIFIIAWFTSQAGQVDANNQRIDAAYNDYTRLYASLDEGTGTRKLLADAVQEIEAAQLRQETIRRVL